MAIVTAVPEKTQSSTAMKKVLDYVMKPKKTNYLNSETGKRYKLISGQNCLPETAHREFMNTKEQYRKAHGVFFKHYVQSFKTDCGATPDQIHQMGIELAKRLEGFEIVIATHLDTDHWHNHFVVNSVNCETGLKIQINEKGLERLREQSDEICRQFGVEVLAPYQKPEQRAMSPREYRAAMRGNSWKMKLLSAIEKAIAASGSKTQFIRNMEQMGYGVKWIEHYKYITYTTPDGQKCRDNRLFDEKYLKLNMEGYFAGLEKADGYKQGNQRHSDGTVSAGIDWSKTRTVERSGKTHNDGRHGDNREHGAHIEAADTGRHRLPDGERGSAAQYRDRERYYVADEELHGIAYNQTDRSREKYAEDYDGADIGYDGEDANARFIPDKAQSQMGADWGDFAVDALALAASIEAMVTPPKKKKKSDFDNTKKRRKKQREREWNMER